MGERSSGLKATELLVLIAGLIILIVLIVVWSKPPFYDEDDYLLNVQLIQKYGFTREYLSKHLGSAGPLYPALHYLLAPLTKLQTPQIRLVNIALLTGSIWFIGRTLKALDLPQNYSLLALAIPMTYVISGLALTEMPAIFFLSAAIYLVIKVRYKASSFIADACRLALAGFLIGFAILGRQPFLLVLFALPFLFLRNRGYLESSLLLLILITCSLVLPLYVFLTWGGLVAPYDATLYDSLARDGVSLQPVFFFICMGYYALVFLLVAPNFYRLPKQKELLALGIIGIISIALNSRYELFLYLPMRYIIEEAFPSIVSQWVSIVCGAGLILGSLYFLITLVRQVISNKFNPALMFFTASILVIAVSCIKITWGFSSRYPAQALPFLVPMFAYFYRENKLNSYSLGIAVLLGLISFASFMAM